MTSAPTRARPPFELFANVGGKRVHFGTFVSRRSVEVAAEALLARNLLPEIVPSQESTMTTKTTATIQDRTRSLARAQAAREHGQRINTLSSGTLKKPYAPPKGNVESAHPDDGVRNKARAEAVVQRHLKGAGK
jgi:hypothetical protein